MPTLILNRPDPKAKGSHHQRKDLWRLQARVRKAELAGDEEQMVDAYEALEQWLFQFATTDDGSDPMLLIKELSAAEFDDALAAFKGESVPLPNNAPSPSGTTAPAALPSGSSTT